MNMVPDVSPMQATARRKDGSGWMITLADLMALMLTFFVLLFSMQRIETGRWSSLREALEMSFDGKASKPAVLTPEEAPSRAGRDPASASATAYYASVLRDNLASLGPGLQVSATGSTVMIGLPDSILVSAPGADGEETAAVNALAEQLQRLGRDITLLGIARARDDARNAAIRWEQALALAVSLSRRLRAAGVARDMRTGANGPDNILAGDVRIVIEFSRDREAQS